MADKVQKIREEVEKRFEQIKNSERESDSGAFYQLKELLEFIDSLQEEPCNSCQGFNDKDKCDELVFTHNCPIVKNHVSIWHDASEMPDKEKKILTIGYNDETYVGYFNGVNPRLIKQWAYIDVLLNLTTKEEPVSEELEKEIINYIGFPQEIDEDISTTMIRKAARHFSNWQKEQDKETIELAEDHAMLAGIIKGTEHTIDKVRSILNKVAYENNGLDVNGDYCEQPYVELDNEFRKLLKEE